MVWTNFYEGLGSRWFKFIHSYKLIYNTCWEDPRADRQALNLGADDSVLMITSAGCNALDYALLGPKNVHAVDLNPRQNALLALKIAAIRTLDFEQFFSMFGKGRLDNYREVYDKTLRPELPDFAREYWDKSISFFSGDGWRSSFYFNGTSGTFARFVNTYIDRVARVREDFNDLLRATTIEEQSAIYFQYIKESFWNGFMKFMMGRNETLSLLGVPKPQRTQVDKTYVGGIVKFIEDRIDAVFAQLPLWDNYFWRVYLTGEYSKDCCPEYLKEENFEALRDGKADCIQLHTSSINDFLETHEEPISRFVLLDHMDWLSCICYPMLEQEWQLIMERAAPDARILWRSGGLSVDFVDPIKVKVGGVASTVGERLRYQQDLAAKLHAQDRVQTYGSFYIADVVS